MRRPVRQARTALRERPIPTRITRPRCTPQATVVGLPIEAQLAWLPSKVIGIALYGFANFNRVRSFAGLTFGLQVGSLR